MKIKFIGNNLSVTFEGNNFGDQILTFKKITRKGELIEKEYVNEEGQHIHSDEELHQLAKILFKEDV